MPFTAITDHDNCSVGQVLLALLRVVVLGLCQSHHLLDLDKCPVVQVLL